MHLVQPGLELARQGIDRGLQVRQDLVAHLDQPGDAPAANVAGDVLGGGARADGDAGKAAGGVAGGGVDHRDPRVAHLHRAAVDQGPATGGENGDVAAAAGEDADVDQPRELVEGAVALVLDVGGAAADGGVTDDGLGKRGDLAGERVDPVDGADDAGVGVGAKALDRRGGVAEVQGQVVGAANHLPLLDAVVRRQRQGAEGALQFGQVMAERGVRLRAAEQVGDAGEQVGLGAHRPEPAPLQADGLEQALVDGAHQRPQRNAGAGAAQHPALEAHDLAREPGRADVGDVVCDRIERPLVGDQSARGRSQGVAQIGGHDLVLVPWACVRARG